MMNESGIYPLNNNILVKPEEVSDRTAGGLFKPDTTLEREQHAQIRGVVVAVCPDAFGGYFDDEELFPDGPPEVIGRTVYFARHNGALIVGEDGVEYRILKDDSITAFGAEV